MRFAQKAMPMLARGIPVIPLKPNSKDPQGRLVPHGARQATLDPAQVAQWDQEQPNMNCGAVAVPGQNWMLDFDDHAIIDRILFETGQPCLPTTFTVKTKRGFHLYFKQNAASHQLGNQKLAGQPWESRQDYWYVVAPGSVHPDNLTTYTVEVDADIIEAPAWLTDWLIANAPKRRPKPEPVEGNPADVAKSLAWLERWVERHKVVVFEGPLTWAEGGFKFHVECPQRHLHTSDSGVTEASLLIAPDGTVSFRCQHSHCAEFLWLQFRDHYEPGSSERRKQAHQTSSVEEIPPLARPAKLVLQTPDNNPRFFDPRWLYGRLGEIALALKVPLGLAVPALLTVAGVQVPKTNGCRTNLFTFQISRVAGFKGESCERSFEALHFLPMRITPGSERGIEMLLGDLVGSALIYNDEGVSFLQKTTITGSGLMPMMCTLWDQDQTGTVIKAGVSEINVRLSYLGCLAVDKPIDFMNVMPKTVTKGFYDRLFLGVPGEGELDNFPYVDREELNLSAIKVIKFTRVQVQQERFAEVNGWVERMRTEFPTLPKPVRLGVMILRIATILASANGEREISDGVFATAMAIGTWQCHVRMRYFPSGAANPGSQINEAIKVHLSGEPPHSLLRADLLDQVQTELGCSMLEAGRELDAMIKHHQVLLYQPQEGPLQDRVWLRKKARP